MLQLSNAKILMIQITLSPTFPTTAPYIQVLPVCRHAYLDAQSNVIHPAVTGWEARSDLGYVVGQLVVEFSKT